MFLRSRVVLEISALALASATVVSSFAQDYPNKPIRIITAAVGGGSDFTARQIAQGITGPLGQPVIVDNRQSILTGELAAKAPPDGYTLLVNGNSIWVSPLLRDTPYDAVRDFAPITLIERSVYILAVHPSLPVKTVKELIDHAKSQPGKINYAAGGKGGSQQVATELFSSMTGIKLVYVPYKGNAQEISALLSGEVQMIIMDAGLLAPHIKSGKIRALAATSAEPSALTPGLPTVAASGVPGYVAIGTTAMWAPAKTPTAIVNRLNREVVRFLTAPDVKEKFLSAGVEVVASSPEQFASYLKSDIAGVSKLIKDGAIKPD